MPTFKPDSLMTFDTAEACRRRLVDFLKQTRESDVIMDLSVVSHCDSAGLALLIEAQRLCRQLHKRCQITNIPPLVHALAEFCGLEKIVVS
ncbi:anti-sigma factor antagonist [Legionella taurinensis]|uniref:Anti-sigma factor antagonist n=1 Tax=Legionella taurinensis TaxID=70611 RepID=A0A3A5L859_9GAMM|nr:STAS domain-containing protein [Legionella taurinensis]MDX1836711.1 STAS domain-containing protein [Legionella taurinensis]PUT42835.1 sulfate transporter [Legionella taurinensis]PUT45390.1 sulfate transporter [Legionella taurinensis]PUT47035.1 sulfate transporter [Legionella taurinensis]PUT49157.1 sulfate transporter [Legionella taurinensis]